RPYELKRDRFAFEAPECTALAFHLDEGEHTIRGEPRDPCVVLERFTSLVDQRPDISPALYARRACASGLRAPSALVRGLVCRERQSCRASCRPRPVPGLRSTSRCGLWIGG